jgi:hypothetical protein
VIAAEHVIRWSTVRKVVRGAAVTAVALGISGCDPATEFGRPVVSG